MILYDDKQNFLGMSSHTLSFLGYEDIGDFLSLHNDFANLFVNQEGYIYKFDNFSWIDFVLYSGSANKSAIVTLKNGQDTKVDLSIKEVHLAHPLNGINKLYSVKIISDNFHKISGVPKSNDGISGFSLSGIEKDELSIEDNAKENITNIKTTGFSLTGLIDNDIAIEEKTKMEIPKDDFLKLAEEKKEAEEKKSESFILNIDEDKIPDQKEIEPMILEEETTTPVAVEDFKLDFSKVQTPSQEVDQSSDLIMQESEENIEESQENTFNSFLLQDESTENREVKEEVEIQQNTEPATELFDFNLLKNDTQEKKSEITPAIEKEEDESDTFINLIKENEPQADEVNLNFISNQNVQQESEAVTDNQEDEEKNESGFKLDFLKIDKESEEETKEESFNQFQEEPASSEVFEIKQKSEKIIQQIKDDIKEIDAEYKKSNSASSEATENETFSLNIEESPLKAETEQTVSIEETEEISYDEEKVMSNFQIQESKTVDTNRSFTNTLKGLFATANKKSSNQTAPDSEDKRKDEAFSFTLKNSNDDKKAETDKIQKEIDIAKKYTEEEKPQATIKSPQEFKLSSLNSLGLDPEDEFDLLSDFISDAEDSIETIEQFIKTDDFDKINYALVKIKSSAEILKLDAIIENSNNMRKHCITEDSEKVTEDTQKLKENIEQLKMHLEAAAI
jgi:HPt (histidine-containing phosphotransfer) domain-containing protein